MAKEKRNSLKMVSMFKRLKQSVICVAVVLMATPAIAAKDPLDFNYRIAGDARVRPVLVFNDGQDIYIQPNPETAADIKIVGATAEKEGPYFVIRGLTSSFSVQLKKGGAAEVSYKGSFKPQAVAQPAVKEPVAIAKTSDTPKPMDVKPQVAAGQSKGEIAPKIDSCVPRIDRKESAFVVSFPGKSAKMSAQTESQLKLALDDASSVGLVEITAEDMQGNNKVAAARAAAIGSVVASQGVVKSKIKTSTREATGIGSELRVVKETVIPCKVSGINVSYRDSRHVSVAGDADAKVMITQLATEAKLDLAIEGREMPIPLSLVERDKPLLAILEIIGNKLGDKADLVYRGKALILRYRLTN